MTAPDVAPAPRPADDERRLHPGSWLFALLQNLRQFILPLLVLLFAGGRRDDGYPWWLPLIGGGALVAVSVWQYLTFRYRIADDRLVVRSGLLERSVRQIPYSRIHNVAIHQSLLHRLMGVAEVRLESAGGTRPEAEMRVLRLGDALDLEQLIRDRGQAAAAAPARDAPAAGETLLALSTIEVVKLGLVSNRGMIVVAGALALAFQVLPERALRRWLVEGGREAFGYASGFATTWLAKTLAAAAFLALVLALIRAFSVLLALVRYHGFRLQRQGRRLTVERGLLSRSRSSVPRRRIQAWTLTESVLHRLFGRRTLDVDTASARGGNGEGNANAQRGLDALAPIAPPATCDAIVREIAHLPDWPPAHWQALHPRAWLRLLLGDVLFTAALCAALAWFFQWWGVAGLLWLPWSAFVARRHAARAGYAIDEVMVAIREGWWKRHWRLAETAKLQAVELRQSPLDRGFGMASIWLDTAGAGALAPPLRLRFLPLADAERIHAQLAARIARQPLRW